jgi:hypothetical protein
MSDVGRIHDELISLREIVRKADSLSDLNAFEAMASKTLLLAAASHFEKQICDTILRCAIESGTPKLFAAFIDKQGLERKYHSMFQWDKANINRFLSLFGADHKKSMEKALKADDSLSAAVNDFVFIGSQRNLLVHNNYAAYNIDASMDEIWTKFEGAQRLSDWLPGKLMELANTRTEQENVAQPEAEEEVDGQNNS